jgi:hypothetical protein
MSKTAYIFDRHSELRSDIDKMVVALLKKTKGHHIKMDEETQFVFKNTEETVKSVMLRDDGMVLVFTEGGGGETIEHDFTDLPTDEMLAIYQTLL